MLVTAWWAKQQCPYRAPEKRWASEASFAQGAKDSEVPSLGGGSNPPTPTKAGLFLPRLLTFFRSSSFSMGSTAQHGLAKSMKSKRAYLQNPQALQRKGSFSS